MYLTFEVVSANATAPGVARRKVFTVDGGRIGRAPENDMVLPGVGVHRHHATVRFINGVFFVEGVGTNGIAINDPDRVLPRNEPYPLKTGDKVYIDEYEVAVTASAAAPAEPAARAASRDPVRPVVESTSPGARSSAPIIGAPGESADDLDPLRKLAGGAAAPSRPQRPVESSWNHSSSLSDHFTPPPAPPATADNVIPENWDRTSFDRSKLQPAQAQVPPVQAQPPAHGQRPAGVAPSQPPPQRSSQGSPPQYVAPPSHGAPSSHGGSSHGESSHGGSSQGGSSHGGLSHAGSSHGGPASAGGSQSHAGYASSGARAAVGGAAGESRANPPLVDRRAPSTSGAAFDWDGFLRAAGVDPARVPPETAAALGNIMRSVVQGLIEVLRARSEIKTEFRMPVTQVKVSENNPLKFAANADDALGNLLGKRNSAYLAPQEAFDDAFNDVRFHQLAMLAGVRAGFDNLLNRFDPAQLQELFERQGKRGGLFGGGKASYWDRYAERYGEMTADRDETFRRLFGEEFARAYEQQLSVLKRSRVGNP